MCLGLQHSQRDTGAPSSGLSLPHARLQHRLLISPQAQVSLSGFQHCRGSISAPTPCFGGVPLSGTTALWNPLHHVPTLCPSLGGSTESPLERADMRTPFPCSYSLMNL